MTALLPLQVNNLGSTPVSELAVVCRAAMARLRAAGICVARLYSGTLMTSLDAAGVSLTLLRVNAAMLARLDAATDAPAWPQHAGQPGDAAPPVVSAADDDSSSARSPHAATTACGVALRASIRAGARAVAGMETQLTSWDAAVGDGDCGTTLAAGAAAVLQDEACYDVDDPAATAAGLAASVRRAMGGTSGVLYDIFFTAAEAALRSSSSGDSWTPRLVAALEQAARAVAHHGSADKGMRTMLDALLPAAEAARAAVAAGGDAAAALEAAAAAAERGADATMSMPALAGRSSYVPASVLVSTPDPGAKAAAAWLRGAATAALGA